MRLHLRHVWSTAAVQHLVSISYKRDGTAIDGDLPVTEVLQRCVKSDCAAVRTVTLDGHWTLREVAGPVPSMELEKR